jgi:hypothetical protein
MTTARPAREEQSTATCCRAFLLDPDGNDIEAVYRGG